MSTFLDPFQTGALVDTIWGDAVLPDAHPHLTQTRRPARGVEARQRVEHRQRARHGLVGRAQGGAP